MDFGFQKLLKLKKQQKKKIKKKSTKRNEEVNLFTLSEQNLN